MTGFTEYIDPPKTNGKGHSNNGQMPKFTAVRLDKIVMPPNDPALVEDVLFSNSLAVAYGEPGCGKSFLISHLALHVAAGQSWAGKSTSPGAVVYVTAEGARGFLKRMVAFRESLNPPDDVPFFVVTDAPDLGHRGGDAGAIIERIREQVGGQVALVIIDTLARVLQGAEGNSSADMSILIDNASAIMQGLDATVLLVHHSGKDANKGARGSSVLRAAVDTEILIEKTATGHAATITKQKDGESSLTLDFVLDQVEIAGTGQTSCLVTVGEWEHSIRAKKPKVSRKQLIAMRALETAIADHGQVPPRSTLLSRTIRVVRVGVWRDACARVQSPETDNVDSRRRAFTRLATKLQEGGFIGVFDDWVWIVK